MPLGTEVGLGPCHIVLGGDLAPPKKRGTVSPTFRPMSVVAKWLPISATAELLLTSVTIALPFKVTQKSAPFPEKNMEQLSTPGAPEKQPLKGFVCVCVFVLGGTGPVLE